jgi:L-threonylcarbamoyladenylate synthase
MGGKGVGGGSASGARRATPNASQLDGDAALRFARCLADGGVVLFPADTVYGLACDPENAAALRWLYELKGRPPARPAAVMFFALSPALAALPELGARTRAALERLLPGPVTVLLANPVGRFALACDPARALAGETGAADAAEHAARAGEADAPRPDAPPREAAGAALTLGLRVPALDGSLAALAQLDRPVLQSSANLSGGAEARRLRDVDAGLRAAVDLALDGGELPGVASTVLDLRDYERAGGWRIVRAGPVGAERLRQILG